MDGNSVPVADKLVVRFKIQYGFAVQTVCLYLQMVWLICSPVMRGTADRNVVQQSLQVVSLNKIVSCAQEGMDQDTG